MKKTFFTLPTAFLFVVLLASCTKKSSDNPSPSGGGSSNTNNTTTKTIVLYDSLWVTFKGKSYKSVGPKYLPIWVSSSFGADVKTKPEFKLFAYSILPYDSSKLVKINVDTLNPKHIGTQSGGGGWPIFFAGDTAEYSTGRPVYKGQKVCDPYCTTYSSNQLISRYSDANNFIKLTSLKYQGVYQLQNPFATNQTYSSSIWQIKGNFKFVLYNENHFNDSTRVQGNFSVYISARAY